MDLEHRNIFDDYPFPVDTETNNNSVKDKKNIVIINNDKKKKKLLLKKRPKSRINLEPTLEQKWRQYQTYTVPQLAKYDVEKPDNDLVKAIKKAFGEDNKETLNNTVNTTFTYENDIVKNKIRNDLFDTEERLLEDERRINRDLNYKELTLEEKARNTLAANIKRGIFMADLKKHMTEQLGDTVPHTFKNLNIKNREYDLKKLSDTLSNKHRASLKLLLEKRRIKPSAQEIRKNYLEVLGEVN